MRRKNLKSLKFIFCITLYAAITIFLIRTIFKIDVDFYLDINRLSRPALYLVLFNINGYGNYRYDRYLNKKLPWYGNIKKRLLVQLSFMFTWSFLTLLIPMSIWLFNRVDLTGYSFLSLLFIGLGAFFVVNFMGIPLIINFYFQIKKSIETIKDLEYNKLKTEYKALQERLNPHFLFNSLTVLISEIRHDSKTAEQFARNLSMVYRYVLQSGKNELIELDKELKFIGFYTDVIKVRVGNSLKVNIRLNDDVKKKFVLPLTFQLLIENILKHNSISEEEPLVVSIDAPDENTVTIRNNVNLKKTQESTKTGLGNMEHRYKLLNKDGFYANYIEGDFVVRVPLFNTNLN